MIEGDVMAWIPEAVATDLMAKGLARLDRNSGVVYLGHALLAREDALRDALRATLTSDKAIEAMILAAAHPAHDDGHTDTYYRGLMNAALSAALGTEDCKKTGETNG